MTFGNKNSNFAPKSKNMNFEIKYNDEPIKVNYYELSKKMNFVSFNGKKIYDYIVKHQSEIENKIGATLEWNRKDDTKASRIHIQLNDVSISSETDWSQMAKFHADWSKKFYDAMVPYLDAID